MRYILPGIFFYLFCLMPFSGFCQDDSTTENILNSRVDEVIRGQFRAVRFTTLSAGLSGRIRLFEPMLGQRVKKGAKLLVFDCNVEKAGQSTARAKLTASESKLKVNQRLSELSNISGLELQMSKAEVLIAKSELLVISELLKNCMVVSPFNAVITAKHVQAHQFVSKGEPLLDIVDTSRLEIEMVVPSNWVDRLKPGVLLTVTVIETGKKIKAKLDRIVGVVDPVSQTIRVIGRLLVKPKNVMPGMSALIRFQPKG